MVHGSVVVFRESQQRLAACLDALDVWRRSGKAHIYGSGVWSRAKAHVSGEGDRFRKMHDSAVLVAE